MAKIILAGGSGFLGRSLAAKLVAEGHEPVILSRFEHAAADGIGYRVWDGKTVADWANALEDAHAVVNLTGKSVDCRYTAANRSEIIASRVDSVHALQAAVERCTHPPKVWVQAASLAIYGNPGEAVCDEQAPLGDGFSADVCKRWESAFDGERAPGMRHVLLRIGFALGESGGALGKLAGLTRAYLGGAVGSGRQYISWIHIDDLNAMFLRSISSSEVSGIYNATGPAPVTNAAFMQALRTVLHRPYSPATPEWAVRIGALLMGTEAELALHGRRCIPARFLEQGFLFQHAELPAALRSIYARQAPNTRAGS